MSLCVKISVFLCVCVLCVCVFVSESFHLRAFFIYNFVILCLFLRFKVAEVCT